jgi:hypothetical protein
MNPSKSPIINPTKSGLWNITQKNLFSCPFGDHYILCIITSSKSNSHYLKAVLHPKHCILVYLQVETQFHIQMLFFQAINCALEVYFQDTYGFGKDHTDQRPFSFQCQSQIITSFLTAHQIQKNPYTKVTPPSQNFSCSLSKNSGVPIYFDLACRAKTVLSTL